VGAVSRMIDNKKPRRFCEFGRATAFSNGDENQSHSLGL